MASHRVHPSIRKLFHPSRFTQFRNPWDRKKVAELPLPYQKFYTEWMDSEEKETPVHWIPKTEKFIRNPETGEVKMLQNEPIHVNYPLEMHRGLWGGEGVIQGAVKKGKWRSPVPKFWSPNLQKTIVYSEILDVYLTVVVTERALRLIDQHHGLDDYLITTPAYDLKSLLALKLKRMLLETIQEKNFCKNDSKRQQEILEKYKDYMIPRDELEWYGLSVDEAVEKEKQLQEANYNPIPYKHKFRAQCLEELLQNRMKNASGGADNTTTETTSWTAKLNPFSKG